MLNLPAHTTHLLQVADISVFGPFKRHLPASLTLWRSRHGDKILPKHMAAATRKAWEHATTRSNCIAGFEKAGIVPFDRTKITDKIYKEGVLHRGLPDDSIRYVPPPVPLYPPLVLDSSPSSSPLLSSPPPVVETVSSVLAPPAPVPVPHRVPRAPNTITTTYAVMLTQQQIVDELQRKKDKREKDENEKQERKRKREDKKTETAEYTLKKNNKRHLTSVRRVKHHSNKENTPPTSQNKDYDPYE